MLVVGPNGAGKTNLLESLHVGTQGFSPRTRSDAQLIRFGEPAARVALDGSRSGTPLALEVVLRSGEARESLPAPYASDPLEIGFNAEFLRDGLESVD